MGRKLQVQAHQVQWTRSPWIQSWSAKRLLSFCSKSQVSTPELTSVLVTRIVLCLNLLNLTLLSLCCLGSPIIRSLNWFLSLSMPEAWIDQWDSKILADLLLWILLTSLLYGNLLHAPGCCQGWKDGKDGMPILPLLCEVIRTTFVARLTYASQAWCLMRRVEVDWKVVRFSGCLVRYWETLGTPCIICFHSSTGQEQASKLELMIGPCFRLRVMHFRFRRDLSLIVCLCWAPPEWCRAYVI